MATPRRKLSSPEPDAQPRLRVPAEQLKVQLEDRIARGEALLEEPVNDVASFDARQSDFYSWYEYNQTLLKQAFDSPEVANEQRHVGMAWPTERPVDQRWSWLRGDITSDVRQLASLRDQLPLYKLHPDVESQGAQVTGSAVAGTEVFVVHGHDDGTKETVARFLSKLLGEQPVILHEHPDRGRTIIEKFEHHAAQAACAVVLLTADDLGGAKSGDQKPRARQNVVLELGFFLAKLGRDRVIILHQSGVELPSDIHGMLYTEIDRNGAWRNAVAREIRDIGIKINSDALL